MGVAHVVRAVLSMPPREAARRLWRHAGRMAGQRLLGRLLRNQCTYPPPDPAAPALARRLTAVPADVLAANAPALRRLAADVLAHRFDLLGSGPVRVAHGERYGGFSGHRHGPGPRPPAGGDWRAWIAGRHWRGNRARARRLLDLITPPDYRPIDWQVDFVSGYRWNERTFGPAVAYGHHPGVDVKVPWELARLQHLPGLALAFGLDGDGRLAAEFQAQVLDFLGANPPGWGVNWACAMDVAIRAVNILVARDLFLAHGARFDDEFEAELSAGLLAHARHIAGHLEWNANHRGNHYLADVCGLAWLAAYLPPGDESDIFLVFAVQELAAEIDRQFTPDGGNFEASTAYHRLSAEMALYTVALVLGLPAERRAVFARYDHRLWRRTPALAPAPLAWPPFGGAAFDRLARAARFAHDVTKPSGGMVQVGDNDSGRFVILTPGMAPLDPRHLGAAAAGLFDLDFAVPAVAAVETVVTAALAGGVRRPAATAPATVLIASAATAPATVLTASAATAPATVPAASAATAGGIASHLTRVVIDSDALGDLAALSYPDFGLFLWRGARAFVAVRCGPIGGNGLGGHAHNDQLAVEVEIDGVAWARDPGSFVYTADLAARNAYRSALAHFVPRHGGDEPAAMLAPFRLEDRAAARAVRFDAAGFEGCHHGFARPVWRRVRVGGGRLVIEDCLGGAVAGPDTVVSEHHPAGPGDLAALWGLSLPFSPGYGVRVAAAG